MVPVLLVALLAAATGRADLPVRVPGTDVCLVANLPEGMDPAVVDLEMIRRLYLVRQRFWPDGAPAYPVNLPASSPIREQFSRETFGQGVKDQVAYWNDRYFHGTSPPPTVGSTEALVLFLERTEGSVGYLPSEEAAELPENVGILFCLGTRGVSGTTNAGGR